MKNATYVKKNDDLSIVKLLGWCDKVTIGIRLIFVLYAKVCHNTRLVDIFKAYQCDRRSSNVTTGRANILIVM